MRCIRRHLICPPSHSYSGKGKGNGLERRFFFVLISRTIVNFSVIFRNRCQMDYDQSSMRLTSFSLSRPDFPRYRSSPSMWYFRIYDPKVYVGFLVNFCWIFRLVILDFYGKFGLAASTLKSFFRRRTYGIPCSFRRYFNRFILCIDREIVYNMPHLVGLSSNLTWTSITSSRRHFLLHLLSKARSIECLLGLNLSVFYRIPTSHIRVAS